MGKFVQIPFLILAILMTMVLGCETNPPLSNTARPASMFRVGDKVIVRFSGLGSGALEDHNERIREDGTITLPQIGAVQAAGKSAEELQKVLQERFSDYYKHITVTVSDIRYFHVSGQVRNPNKYVHDGEVTVLQAIAEAGGFTDFANRRNVQVQRATGGKPISVNCNEALENPAQNIPIYPGDLIHVKRRYW